MVSGRRKGEEERKGQGGKGKDGRDWREKKSEKKWIWSQVKVIRKAGIVKKRNKKRDGIKEKNIKLS